MKRHSESEIEAKLQLASELLAKGQNQAQISDAIGVSVMTLHRWRKKHNRSANGKSAIASESRMASPPRAVSDSGRKGLHPYSVEPAQLHGEQGASVESLILENRRLKKIVTDLLLEKMRLEEMNEAREASLQRSGASLSFE